VKNIIIIHQYFVKPDQAGAHRVYSHAMNLSKDGFNVVVVTCDANDSQKELWTEEKLNKNLTVFRLKNNGYFHGKQASNNERFSSFLRFSFLSFFKIFFMKKDIIYATSTPLTVAIPALIFKIFFGKKYIFEVRDLWPDVPVSLGYLKNKFLVFLAYSLEYFAYFFASAIIVVSPGMKDEIRLKGFKNKKIFTVENGCDDFFQTEKNKTKENFGLNENILKKDIVVYIGSITANYGIEYILHLAKSMLELSKDVVFLVAGGGYMKDEMISEAENLNILNKNFFYLGSIAKEKVPKLYSLSKLSICVVRDRPEIQKYAVNNKFFDSIASGTPICTNFDSFQTDIAKKNDFCVFIKDLDMQDAAKKVLEYINNEDWLMEASGKARSVALNQFNRAKQSKKIIEIINGI
tara:strand:+ start:5866 stop:7083 length:1218 start_codon:yes stop_codon:yes gene_type:complete